MKIATGIIAIMLGLLVLLQSCTIGAGSSLTGNQAMAEAGGVGAIAGFFLFVGGAFAFGLPMVGAIVFIVAAFVAVSGADQIPDLRVWAVLSLVLAAMALFAWGSDRKKRKAGALVNDKAGSTNEVQQ